MDEPPQPRRWGAPGISLPGASAKPRRKAAEVREEALRAIPVWACQIWGLPEGTPIEVREENHCIDPSCPIKRVVVETGPGVEPRRSLMMIRPLVLVTRHHVEEAAREAPEG